MVEVKLLLVSDGVTRLVLAVEPLMLSEGPAPVVEDKLLVVVDGVGGSKLKLAHIAARIPSPSSAALSSVLTSNV